jgi:hypothetical protein
MPVVKETIMLEHKEVMKARTVSSDKLVGTFDTRTGREQVRVHVTNHRGKTRISTSMYRYRGGDWHLTKDGVHVPTTKVHKLVGLLGKAAESVAKARAQSNAGE